MSEAASVVGSFDRLHPAIQHHVVNSLGWRQLRPLQESAIEPLLAGHHVVLIAPTAGGKTEAAVLPLFSRMLDESWQGLSVLYVCPLRALLNNLYPRLERYATLVGRRVGLWHGDTAQPERERLVADPPDVLLTTPESLESMLVSTRVRHHRFFAGVRAVVVDEAHAFAGDDRGWHLLSVLERIGRLSGREIQRVALSATLGNPEELLAWLTRTCQGPSSVVSPPAEARSDHKVVVDYVGGLHNAATVISRLHHGDKRLVFVDSRSRAEQLAFELRGTGTSTFVSHGSLSQGERRAAETAFSEARDCVIVATSTLELGIDVGDLDHVIQVDAPPSVASFLQRLGRSGRRVGTSSSALMLATNEEELLDTLAVLLAWRRGYVEPVVPPPLPLHIAAQQLLALTLQEPGVGRNLWTEWLGHPFVLGADTEVHLPQIVEHLVEEGYLHDGGGVLGMGREGEASFGHQHFMELLAVFAAPPMFSVRHGAHEIGTVPVETLLVRPAGSGGGGAQVLVLGGRGWSILSVDWTRRVVHVEPTEAGGIARWFGHGAPMTPTVARCARDVLAGEDPPGVELSKRVGEKLAALRERCSWADPGATTLVREQSGRCRWWTFAGWKANLLLAAATAPLRRDARDLGELSIALDDTADLEKLKSLLDDEQLEGLGLSSFVVDQAIDDLKFAECLPEELAWEVVAGRLLDRDAVRQVLRERLTSWVESGSSP